MKLVIFPPVEPERLQRIREAAGRMQVVNAAAEAEALQEVAEARAFFGKMTPGLLRQASDLRWVQSPTASLEHYIFPELTEHPCTLTNMRGLYDDVIADHVMGFVLCFARNLHRYIRQQQQARWSPVGGEAERSTFSAGQSSVSGIDRAHRHVSDYTLGVVGVGSIGAEICQRAYGFGMKLLGVDPVRTHVRGVLDEVWPVDRLGELLAHSDFVVIAAPHTPETARMFRAEQFRQMKRSAILINIGRGAIVDLADLTAALQEGTIAGAALDVLETEPLPPDHALWSMENVIITPHVAAASPRIAERHLATLLENVRRFAAEEPLLNVVDKRKWF